MDIGWAWHRFLGNGEDCTACGLAARFHKTPTMKWAWHGFTRDKNGPNVDVCDKCGLSEKRHRKPDERERVREDTRSRPGRDRGYSTEYLGLDGEGQGKENHYYIFLAASNEDGTRQWSVQNYDGWYIVTTPEYCTREWVGTCTGLTTEQCFEFLLMLPTFHSRAFVYSFNYDLTKMFTDMPNEVIWLLMRPEKRKRRGIGEQVKGPYAVRWKNYSLNLQGSKFSIGRYGERRRVIWDIWKFYQSKFVESLKDWKIGTPEDWEHMERMKNKRSEFDKEPIANVIDYCLKECRFMAAQARLLFEAHEKVGLRLRSFYGAGSSASAMLGKMGIKEQLKAVPEEMLKFAAQAFSGGRFENSGIGMVRKPVYNFDISSAYPYQLCFLPCLIHGTWKLTNSRIEVERHTHALVHYRLPDCDYARKLKSWGPFPFREDSGNICYPTISGGGWVWKDEYLAGEKLFAHVQFREAWVYESSCNCQPFKDIPEYYMERCRIGKEGPGIVLKLGINSCYGKLAQSVGQAQYNNWIWAGSITSGCRAQCLEMAALHKNRANLLMIATDGIFTLEDIAPPKPLETGTDIFFKDDKGNMVKKPLGGWERKVMKKGLFMARPGVYFPLNPTEDEIKTVRGRGVGKGTVLQHWKIIVDAWEKDGLNGIARVPDVSRFCGAKTSISRSRFKGEDGKYKYKRAKTYGQWVLRKIELGFNPMPKRTGVNPDGFTLTLRHMPPDLESKPYKKADAISQDALMMELLRIQMMEQPDADLADYSDDEG